ncbi:MAG: hypothetical protein ABL883_13915 [Terricaulis sp.]
MSDKPLLQSLIGGVRRVLALQVLLSIFAAALAAWTLAVTTGVMRERDRLNDRVIQLEGELASRNIVVPPPQRIVEASPAYPPEVAAAAASSTGFNASEALTDLFAPPPPLARVVLHVRAESDAEAARELVRQMQTQSLDVSAHLLPAGADWSSGYYYFDGRQSASAAQIVARFNDAARKRELAPWSAQLRGTAMPARGEFGADRLDIVLPQLPPPPTPAQLSPNDGMATVP